MKLLHALRHRLRLLYLVIVYVALFGLYVATPTSFAVLRHAVSPIMLVMLGVIFIKSIDYILQP